MSSEQNHKTVEIFYTIFDGKVCMCMHVMHLYVIGVHTGQ